MHQLAPKAHLLYIYICLSFLLTPISFAQEEEIIVIAVTPDQSTGLPAEKIPYYVQSISADDMEKNQSLDVTDIFRSTVQSISANDAQNNPLQADIHFRGFTASPLLGLSQGLAVYQNGVRINEPLGDTVNWDLLPASAIESINIIGGANPIFGLNTLGGAISIHMKNGFNTKGNQIEVYGGSFDRYVVSAESGGNSGSWGYYGNVHYFEENGWRDESPSDAVNLYGNISWRNAITNLNLHLQHGDSNLLGNGTIPIELLAVDRDAIFTAPDSTGNNLFMLSFDGSHELSQNIRIGVNTFFRQNDTDAFNGDASEFSICELGSMDRLLEGLDDNDLGRIGLDDDDICEDQFPDVDILNTFLNTAALTVGEDPEFNVEDLTSELTGTGILSDSAINNISSRSQESHGTNLQLSIFNDLFTRDNQFVLGISYFNGKSRFHSETELSDIDPVTRSTAGLGTGTFVDDAATLVKTGTKTYGLYVMNTMDVSEKLAFSLSARFNHTDVSLRDLSGQRPELDGEHNFSRINPGIGFAYQHNQFINFYGSYSESSRSPTPIELACNDSVFELAVAAAIADGEDPDDVDFECRLPNAFLADPPLKDVTTKSFEGGVRGGFRTVNYHLGYFHSTNYDDIIFQSTGRSTGLFANVDKSRRKGLEANLKGSSDYANWYVAYTFLDASFEDDFMVISPNHPYSDNEGEITVSSGDRVPGLPRHSLKIGADYTLIEDFNVGFNIITQSDQVLRGDESNQLSKLDGFTVVNLHARYSINENVEVFARIVNLFDKQYETFGLFGEEPNEAELPLFDGFTDPRFVGPAAPRAGFVGLKIRI